MDQLRPYSTVYLGGQAATTAAESMIGRRYRSPFLPVPLADHVALMEVESAPSDEIHKTVFPQTKIEDASGSDQKCHHRATEESSSKRSSRGHNVLTDRAIALPSKESRRSY
jgi:hypothetical protein